MDERIVRSGLDLGDFWSRASKDPRSPGTRTMHEGVGGIAADGSSQGPGPAPSRRMEQRQVGGGLFAGNLRRLGWPPKRKSAASGTEWRCRLGLEAALRGDSLRLRSHGGGAGGGMLPSTDEATRVMLDELLYTPSEPPFAPDPAPTHPMFGS